MVRATSSLGSEEGIDELRRFLCNLRKDGKRGSFSLILNLNIAATNPNSRVPLASKALVPESDCLA